MAGALKLAEVKGTDYTTGSKEAEFQPHERIVGVSVTLGGAVTSSLVFLVWDPTK